MSKADNKRVFAVEVDGKEIKLAVVRPTQRVQRDADLAYAKAFRTAVEAGLLLRSRLEKEMRAQEFWDDAREGAAKDLMAAVAKLAADLAAAPDPKAGFAAAVALRRARAEFQALVAERNELDRTTVEAHADNARFDYLVAACTVYSDTGKPYFKGVDDYLGREDDPAVRLAAAAVGEMAAGLKENYEAELPENAFLLKHGMADADLRIVRWYDEAGRLVDGEGNPVETPTAPAGAEAPPPTAAA